jgi:hypothetical protein
VWLSFNEKALEFKAMLPSPPRCEFPGCDEFPMHGHHVTYNPEVIKPLCVKHHEEITIINGIQGRKYRTSLSNKHRWWIWYHWLRGELKPRKTQKAMEYIEEMRRGPERPTVVSAVEIEPEPESEPLPVKKRPRQAYTKKVAAKHKKRKTNAKRAMSKRNSVKMRKGRKRGGRREKAN